MDNNYDNVKLHTAIKMYGRFFTDINIKELLEICKIECKIEATELGVLIKTNNSGFSNTFLVPYNNVVVLHRS